MPRTTSKRHVVFGPPGTGKTTYLIAQLREALARGVAPDRIGFLSFTRRAIKEARDAARTVTTAELPHVRTIHSLAHHLLGLESGDVVGAEQYTHFGELIGLPFDAEASGWEGGVGNRCLALGSLAKARGTSLVHEWNQAPELDLPWRLVSQTCDMWERYKAANGLWDFDDMVAKGTGRLDVDVLFVDEAQDTSAMQWAFLRRVAAHVPVVYFAGDDDQAIYHWSGADPDQLLRMRGVRSVLPLSYRLPHAVKAVADRISGQIRRRQPKIFAPRDDPGAVRWIAAPEALDLHGPGSWLLLARSNYQLTQFRQQARQQGVVYTLPDGRWSWSLAPVQAAKAWEALRKGRTISKAEARQLNAYLAQRVALPRGEEITWERMGLPEPMRAATWMDALVEMPLRDREYVRALRRSGESLSEPGRVTIGTVHSAKGGQADHVVLLTDVSARVARAAQADPDSERRVQYVGVTRARKHLTLILPQTATAWEF